MERGATGATDRRGDGKTGPPEQQTGGSGKRSHRSNRQVGSGKTGPPEQQTGGDWKDRATGATDRR